VDVPIQMGMTAPPAPYLDTPAARGREPTPDWLTPSEAALLFGVSVATVESLVARGGIRVTAALPGRRSSMGMVSTKDLRDAIAAVAPAPSMPPPPPAPSPAAATSPAPTPAPAAPPRIVVLPSEAPAPTPAPRDPSFGLAPESESRAGRRPPPRRARLLAVAVSAGLVIAIVAAVTVTRGHGHAPGSGSGPRATATGTSAPTPTAEPSPGALALDEPRFVDRGGWLTAAVTITNPNHGWWVPYLDVIFTIRSAKGKQVAAPVKTVTVPPGGSVMAILPGFALPKGSPAVANILAVPGAPEWDDASSFKPSPFELLGDGLNSDRTGELRVGVLVSNSASQDAWGTVTCVTRNDSGGLTGAGTVTQKLQGDRHRMVWVPVAHPSPGSTGVTCEIVPVGG
jgi:hypothetical protein